MQVSPHLHSRESERLVLQKQRDASKYGQYLCQKLYSMWLVGLVLNFRFIQPTFTSTSILVFLLGLAVFTSTVGTTFAFTSIGTTKNDVLLVLFRHVAL